MNFHISRIIERKLLIVLLLVADALFSTTVLTLFTFSLGTTIRVKFLFTERTEEDSR